jgi:histidine triad (HIT) family protein
MNCIFCEIASREAPASFVYKGELVYAILSLEQPTPYKILVIPYEHVETLYDLTEEQASAIFQATVKVACAVRQASGCQGLNLVQSNGRVGQQDVLHFHMHLIPRFEGDGIVLKWNNTPSSRGQLDKFAREIRSKL